MWKKIKDYARLLKLTFVEFNEDNAIKLSASLAYYTVFSIGPVILIIVSLAGLFFEQERISLTLYEQMKSLVGERASKEILNISENMRLERKANVYTLIGFVVLFFGASGVFAEIQNSINYIFSIKAKPKKGWLKFLTDRLTSFSLVLGIGFVLIVALVINTVTDLFVARLVSAFPEMNVLVFQVTNFVLVFVIVTLLFGIIYRVLPDAVIRWKDAMVGASFTAVLFIIGKFIISYYLATSTMSITYGAAASIILLLSWVYYSSAILYFGAEFTKVYAVEKGAGIKVYKTAVFVEKREVKELYHKKEEGTTEDNKTLKSLQKEQEHNE